RIGSAGTSEARTQEGSAMPVSWLVLTALVLGQAPEPPPVPAAVSPPPARADTLGDPPTGAPGTPAADAPADGQSTGERGQNAISGNPAAVNIITGTGAIGRLLGLGEDTGVRLGGLWIGDASGVLVGGAQPGKWGLDGLTVIDLNIDAEKFLGWRGGMF